ncbi:MAG: toprim domain-containing protein [Candidatus Pacearchaeota archaeon]|nr:toprim domain-containing protein [Candidatus Pacearchaeota archaeon]
MQKIELLKEIDKAKEYLVVVEGPKDKAALKEIGFKKIIVLNENGKSLNEKIEEIEKIANENKSKVCILTDFDRKGKKLYLQLKTELSIRKVKMNNDLRAKLLKEKISHIEGLATFFEKIKF